MSERTEFLRVTDDELRASLRGDEREPTRKPYHYPPCATGTCEGCDAQAGVDATQLMGATA